jgi:hypothetical protein
VGPGESVTVPKGTTVTYANPFEAECEYWAVCLPAFSVARAGRLLRAGGSRGRRGRLFRWHLATQVD